MVQDQTSILARLARPHSQLRTKTRIGPSHPTPLPCSNPIQSTNKIQIHSNKSKFISEKFPKMSSIFIQIFLLPFFLPLLPTNAVELENGLSPGGQLLAEQFEKSKALVLGYLRKYDIVGGESAILFVEANADAKPKEYMDRPLCQLLEGQIKSFEAFQQLSELEEAEKDLLERKLAYFRAYEAEQGKIRGKPRQLMVRQRKQRMAPAKVKSVKSAPSFNRVTSVAFNLKSRSGRSQGKMGEKAEPTRSKPEGIF